MSPKIQKIAPQRFCAVSLTRGNAAPIFANRTSPTETELAGWAYRIRTAKSARALSDWNCVTTSPRYRKPGGGDFSRASCVMRISLCGFRSGEDSAAPQGDYSQNMRTRPRARGLARRDARRFDHVTLMRGAAALAVATYTPAAALDVA